MDTPIFDFLTKYSDDNFSRFHMPGAKGKTVFPELNQSLDITEIEGADSLYDAEGIIEKSENNASYLFGTEKTLYSTEGSSLAIKTMLTLVSMNGANNSKTVVAFRNSHRAFINSCILLDLDVEWVYPVESSSSIYSYIYTAQEIDEAISKLNPKPLCVYITTPDYLGRIADVKGISDVCKKHNISLLVDNAHGGYLHFIEGKLHPIHLGADMCCDSAHKTMPALTPAAYLHISKEADSFFSQNAKHAMSIHGSTSPSYLTMASLDLCNKYLFKNFKSDLVSTIKKVDDVKLKLREIGFFIEDTEKLKIVINALKAGYQGTEISKMLREKKIECEYSDFSHVVLMISTMNDDIDLTNLVNAFKGITIKEELPLNFDIGLINPKRDTSLSIRQAGLSVSETILTENSIGRICSKAIVPCPPGIPIVMPGEIIDEICIKILKRYSILTVNVIK